MEKELVQVKEKLAIEQEKRWKKKNGRSGKPIQLSHYNEESANEEEPEPEPITRVTHAQTAKNNKIKK